MKKYSKQEKEKALRLAEELIWNYQGEQNYVDYPTEVSYNCQDYEKFEWLYANMNFNDDLLNWALQKQGADFQVEYNGEWYHQWHWITEFTVYHNDIY